MRHTKRNFLFGSPRHAKLRRLAAKGMLPTKAELAKLCAEATATITPTKCEPQQRSSSDGGSSTNHRA